MRYVINIRVVILSEAKDLMHSKFKYIGPSIRSG